MTSLLPKNLQDKSFLALEECVKEAFGVNRVSSSDRPTTPPVEKLDMKRFMTSLVDYLSDEILEELAEQYHIKEEGWRDCLTRDERIALIKKAVPLHKIKGTVGAVEDFLESLGAKCKMWRDYDGIPHHYKIDLDYINKGVDVYETAERIVNKISCYKQLRAKLDEIDFGVGVQKSLSTASALLIGDVITVDFRGGK